VAETSQADSASSILVTRSDVKSQARATFRRRLPVRSLFERPVRAINVQLATGAKTSDVAPAETSAGRLLCLDVRVDRTCGKDEKEQDATSMRWELSGDWAGGPATDMNTAEPFPHLCLTIQVCMQKHLDGLQARTSLNRRDSGRPGCRSAGGFRWRRSAPGQWRQLLRDHVDCSFSVTRWTSYCQQAGLTAGWRLPCPLRMAARRAALKLWKPWGLSSVHRSMLN
jgi:hypothetical protein